MVGLRRSWCLVDGEIGGRSSNEAMDRLKQLLVQYVVGAPGPVDLSERLLVVQ